jgi:hypothetical protein
MKTSRLNQKSPLLSISEWIQGDDINIDQLIGKVILVEVFQVNCPGCFLYSLPEAIRLYQFYASKGLVVAGVATAFEDFDKNNLENLCRLVKNGEVIGETLRSLSQHGMLIKGPLPYRIHFPIAMDRLNKRQSEVTDQELQTFINEKFPDFESLAPSQQYQRQQQVKHYLESLEYHAETFETFQLQGTPFSHSCG